MDTTIEDLLSLEQLDNNLFRSQYHCENFKKTLFGGQVLGQALKAAFSTQDDALPHSLHAYFLRPGSSESPVIYDVEKVRDGNAFASRRAVARQFGRPIFNMSASFHKEENGYQHQIAMPENLAHPEDLLSERGLSGSETGTFEYENSVTPFLLVPVDESVFSNNVIQPPRSYFWIKSSRQLSEAPIVHYCALAFASDLGLLATALLPHPTNVFSPKMVVASIDHAMWFHRRHFRVDEWLLCSIFSPWAGNARGFAQAHIFDLAGNLVASTAQEGLIRPL